MTDCFKLLVRHTIPTFSCSKLQKRAQPFTCLLCSHCDISSKYAVYLQWNPTSWRFSWPGARYKSYHMSYQKFILRPLLREPRPYVHYKSQPNAINTEKTQKSTNAFIVLYWVQLNGLELRFLRSLQGLAYVDLCYTTGVTKSLFLPPFCRSTWVVRRILRWLVTVSSCCKPMHARLWSLSPANITLLSQKAGRFLDLTQRRGLSGYWHIEKNWTSFL